MMSPALIGIGCGRVRTLTPAAGADCAGPEAISLYFPPAFAGGLMIRSLYLNVPPGSNRSSRQRTTTPSYGAFTTAGGATSELKKVASPQLAFSGVRTSGLPIVVAAPAVPARAGSAAKA